MKKIWATPQLNEISVKVTEHGFGVGNDGINGKDNSVGNPNPGTSSGGGHS